MTRNLPTSPELLSGFGRVAIAFARTHSLDPNLVYCADLQSAGHPPSSVTLSSLRESLTLAMVGRHQKNAPGV
jgi:hypothetical protein